MNNQSFTTSFLVSRSPKEVFDAINNVTAWWTENLSGRSQQLNDEFSVRFGDVHYSKQKLVEVVPDKRVVWLITESRLSFIEDKSEWTGTKVIFDISVRNRQTEVTFTHLGLVPLVECYGACKGAWTDYILGSLQSLIATGKGQPASKEAGIGSGQN
ncbi:MAG: SRPBCC family protein [Imperialibacter sp.]|uniref:SRPBCC family protein n=1 Tax=Imperialibacter sp. TaxID=2038411 RepID=UPI003A85577F